VHPRHGHRQPLRQVLRLQEQVKICKKYIYIYGEIS
jgi:hypothetical protein